MRPKVILNPFLIIDEGRETDNGYGDTFHPFRKSFLQSLQDKTSDPSHRTLKISFEIDEQHNAALQACEWYQAYNFIKRTIEHIQSLPDDYIHKQVVHPSVSPSDFVQALIQALSTIASFKELTSPEIPFCWSVGFGCASTLSLFGMMFLPF